MTSAIDATKPVAGSPTTQSVRDNFAAAKSEIEALQAAGGDITSVVAGTGLSGGGASGAVTLALATPVSVANGGTNATTAPAALTSLGAVAKAGDTMTGGLVLGAPTGGNLGTGTLNAASDIHCGSVFATAFLSPTGATSEQAQFGFANFNGPKMVCWGSTTGAANLVNWYNSANTELGRIDNSGNLTIAGSIATKPGGGSWVAPSDMQLKVRESIVAYTTGLAEIVQLKPVTYKYNGKAGLPTNETFHGLIADDVETVMPEAVGRAVLGQRPATGDDKGEDGQEYRTFDSTPVLYALLNAVKELAMKVAALENALPPGIQPLPTATEDR